MLFGEIKMSLYMIVQGELSDVRIGKAVSDVFKKHKGEVYTEVFIREVSDILGLRSFEQPQVISSNGRPHQKAFSAVPYEIKKGNVYQS